MKRTMGLLTQNIVGQKPEIEDEEALTYTETIPLLLHKQKYRRGYEDYKSKKLTQDYNACFK